MSVVQSVSLGRSSGVSVVRARKSIKQRYGPSQDVLHIMEDFRQMTNDCIRIGIRNEISTLKRLSLYCYRELRRYGGVPSAYKLCAISKAVGILSSRKKSLRRGYPTRDPHMSKLLITSCYGFRIENGNLIIPIGDGVKESIPLNEHTRRVLSDPSLKVRSFTLTERTSSICVSKDAPVADSESVKGAIGIDRNLRNITAGNQAKVTYYDVSKIVEIAENTRSIVASFKRNDARIARQIASKYGRRRAERTKRILHWITKNIVRSAETENQAIIFEEIRGIRKLYHKGNRQGRRYRGRMNSAPFGEIKRQAEYKATWKGVPVVTLTTDETRGTTMDCTRCGERLQESARGDSEHHRKLWCDVCKRWFDRDLVAVLNISRRGWVRFAHSKGAAVEAMKRNPEHEGEPVILRVDASKPGNRLWPRI